MIKCIRHHLKQFWQDQSGAGTIDGLLWTLSSLAVGSLAMDGSSAWRSRTQLQVAADASALAAAATLGEGVDAARDMAITLANMNLPSTSKVAVLRSEDIAFGYYDDSGFTESSIRINAVQVNGQRLDARGTALSTTLMRLFGRDSFEMSVIATAMMRETVQGAPGCQGGSFISHRNLLLEGADHVTGNMCLHGEASATTHAGSMFDASILISAPSEDQISIGGFGPSSLNEGTIKLVRNLPERMIPEVTATIDLGIELHGDLLMQNGFLDGQIWADTFSGDIFTHAGPYQVVRKAAPWIVSDLTLNPNTIYVVKGDVQILQGTDLAHVAIFSSGTVSHRNLILSPDLGDPILTADPLDPDLTSLDDVLNGGGKTFDPDPDTIVEPITYQNSLIVAASMQLDGEFKIGPTDVCDGGAFNSYFFAHNDVVMGELEKGFEIQGGVVATDHGSITTLGGMFGQAAYMEAQLDITHSGGIDISGCPTTVNSDYDITYTSQTTNGFGATLVY